MSATPPTAPQGNTAPEVDVEAAVVEMGEHLARADLGSPLAGLTCRELDSIARVLRAFGQDENAETITYLHAESDVDSDDAHHDVYPQSWAPRQSHAVHAPAPPGPDQARGPGPTPTGAVL